MKVRKEEEREELISSTRRRRGGIGVIGCAAQPEQPVRGRTR